MARHCECIGEARLKVPGWNGIAIRRGVRGPSAPSREPDFRHAAIARAGRLNATSLIALDALLDSYSGGPLCQEREQIRMVTNHLPRSVFFAKHVRGADRPRCRASLDGMWRNRL